jgi:hypothetical protein
MVFSGIDQTAAKRLGGKWERIGSGSNGSDPAVLGGGKEAGLTGLQLDDQCTRRKATSILIQPQASNKRRPRQPNLRQKPGERPRFD